MKQKLPERQPFKNSTGSLYGKTEQPGLYVVYSYGPHWPLAVWTQDTGWMLNEDKTSPTTTRHRADVAKCLDTWTDASCTYLKRFVGEFTPPHKSIAGQLF